MAERVVVGLEVVDVQHQQAEALLEALRALDLTAEHLHEVAVVEHPRQPVGDGLLLDLLVELGVLHGDRHLAREHLQELEVLAVEGTDLAEGHHDAQPARARAERRRDQALVVGDAQPADRGDRDDRAAAVRAPERRGVLVHNPVHDSRPLLEALDRDAQLARLVLGQDVADDGVLLQDQQMDQGSSQHLVGAAERLRQDGLLAAPGPHEAGNLEKRVEEQVDMLAFGHALPPRLRRCRGLRVQGGCQKRFDTGVS